MSWKDKYRARAKRKAEEARAKRIRRLEDDLSDARDRLWNWGFGMRPSERRAMKEHIEKLESQLEELNPEDDDD